MNTETEDKLKEAFNVFYRQINQHVNEEFSRLMIEAIKSGDFQMCCGIATETLYDANTNTITLHNSVGLTYIPYREVSSLKARIRELEEELKSVKEASDSYEDFMYQATKRQGW